MGKQEQNDEIQQIHTNSGHVLVESTSGSSSSESEGETSQGNVENVEYMTHTEDEGEEEEDEEDDAGKHVDDEHKDEEDRNLQPEEDVAEAIVEDVEYMTHSEDEDEEDVQEEHNDKESDGGEHVDEEHKDEENRNVQPEEDAAEAIVEDVEFMTHSEDEDEEDVEGEHNDREEGDEKHGAEEDADIGNVDNVEYMIHSEDEEDIEEELKDDENEEMDHGAEEYIDAGNVENVEYMTHSEEEDEEDVEGEYNDREEGDEEHGAEEDEDIGNVENVEYMTNSETEEERKDEEDEEMEHAAEEYIDVGYDGNVEYMTHSEGEDKGDVTPREEDKEEKRIWQCDYYPHCTEVFHDNIEWLIHVEATCPFRESEREPQESQNVNPPLPDTLRRIDFTQDLKISDDEDEEEENDNEEDQEDQEEGEDGGEEKQKYKYKCYNLFCAESFEDNEDLYHHELNCEYRVSEGDFEFDQEENPPSPDPSRHSDLMEDSPPSSSFNLSPTSASRDQTEIQPIHKQEQPIHEQEQPTGSSVEDIQHEKQKMKLPQCGACGEILQGTLDELNTHTCSEMICPLCNYTLKNFADLKEHYEEQHNNVTELKCPYCGSSLDQLDERFNMNEHLKNKYCGKGNCYKCKYCEETVLFKFKSDYAQHASQYHFQGFHCWICNDIIYFFYSYKLHKKEHVRSNIFKCPYCGELLNPASGAVSLRRHVKNHMSERSKLFKEGKTPKTYECPRCQKEYVSEAFLKSHGKRFHGTEKLFKCSGCRMEFTNSKDAETHYKKKHNRQLPWKDRKPTETIIANCGACGEILQGTPEEWNNHNCSEAECQFCEYKFNDFPDFVQHYENNHDNETEFVCPYCGVRLNKSSEISIEKQHSRNKNCRKGNYYKCKKCDETVIFKLRKDFKEHNSQYHFRGYQCYICRKIFKHPDFKLHNHVTKEIFKCIYCGTLFTPFNPLGLHKHLRDHANERSEQFKKGETPKTYQCPECQKDYVTEVFLTNHGIQKHGTEYLFKCSECDMEFPTRREADSHFKESHEDPKQGMIMPQCGACGEILPGTSEELNNHTCSEAQCQFCEYKIKDFADLILHYEKNHNNETNFECPYCEYLSNKSDEIYYNNIKEHFHSKHCPKGNYYKCKKCEETVIFKLKKDFLEHDSQYHFRGYQCCICRKIIDGLTNYTSHGHDIHQNSYVYKCPYCCKLLRPSSEVTLREHVKKHMSERSELFKEGKTPKIFRCPKCKKEFVFEYYLKSHGKREHGTENLFDCTECGMEFPTSNDADAHFEEEHPELKRRRQREDPDQDETSHSKKPRRLHE